jgi:hypothetical protein
MQSQQGKARRKRKLEREMWDRGKGAENKAAGDGSVGSAS